MSPFNGESEAETFVNVTHVRYDANALYHNVTKYSMKFIYQTLKRSPRSVTSSHCTLSGRTVCKTVRPMLSVRCLSCL